MFLSKKDRFGGAKGKKLAKECTSVAYARMRPINAPIAPRNIAQGRRGKGIEHSNQPARLHRRPFRTSRNPSIAYRWSETMFRRRLRSHATNKRAERTAQHRARAPSRGNRATKPPSSPSPSTISAQPQPLHCLTVVGGHVLPPPTLACDQ